MTTQPSANSVVFRVGRRTANVWATVPWLVAPAIIVVTGSMLFALVQVVYLSFHEANVPAGGAGRFLGFSNYAELLADPAFWLTLWRATEFTFLSVAGQLSLAVVLAIVGWSDRPWSRIWRAVVAIPWAVPPVVVAIIWRFIYQPDTGWLSALAGLDEGILAAPRWALYALVLVNIWQFTPLYFLFISSGLRAINPSVLEASQLDGASPFQIIWYVMLPQLKPLLTTLAVFNVVSSMAIFDIIWIMTRGGPSGSTRTTSVFVYESAFQTYQIGSAAAAIVLMTVVALMIATLCKLVIGGTK